MVDRSFAAALNLDRRTSGGRPMSEALLRDIAEYCRRAKMAESTFGRHAVNDGKLVSRLRLGGRVTTDTVERVRAFIASEPQPAANGDPVPALLPTAAPAAGAAQNFRFYDNRQKYLLFVTTCSEKWVIAQRVSMELGNIHPRPPALRVFDAGVGDGTVLSRTMRAMHHRFPTMPFYIVAKEISLEDVRLVLEKMPDRLFEHPATVLVMTNMYYSEAPWLTPNSVTAATSLVWHELALVGNTAHDFETQITDMRDFLAENWRALVGRNSGNPIYEKPVVLVIYREDHRFLLDQVRPRRGLTRADYDLVIASQPYRARAPIEFKARRVVAPLARSLAPGGRLIAIHSHGDDPGLEIIRRIWPDEDPFTTDRHTLLRATKTELGNAGRDLNFGAYADARSLFRYDMHTLPSEISVTIGTSTLFAAWNAAVYVAQIEDQRLSAAISSGAYLEATREVLHRHGGLWFWDESYVISRKRDSG
jgi:SAM-dependent methyltransferase